MKLFKVYEETVSVVLRRRERVRAYIKGIVEDAVNSRSRGMRVILAFHNLALWRTFKCSSFIV